MHRVHTSLYMHTLEYIDSFNKFIHEKHIYTQHTYLFSNLNMHIHVCTSIFLVDIIVSIHFVVYLSSFHHITHLGKLKRSNKEQRKA